MTTLEQLVVSWIYVFVECENPKHTGYMQRPGFLIGDRVSIDHLTIELAASYGPDDIADVYMSAGWYVVLMGRLVAKTDTLETALIAANAMEDLVAQGLIHGSMRMHGDQMYVVFDDATLDIMHEAVEKALTA